MTTDTSYPPSAVIRRRFIPCWRGGPFCLRLSLLARYPPDTWGMYLDVDSCAYAEPLETFLDRALVICPQLLLHAIRSMS
jgi:hypothetical protein